MERYLKIGNVNLKHNLLPHILVCIALCVVSPLFLGTRNLDPVQSAKVVEMYLSFIGIILYLPVFAPDMNQDIRELTASKKEPMLTLHMIRTLQATVVILLVGMVFLMYMKNGGCTFETGLLLYTLLANGILLGGMGMLVFAVTDQIVFAYMIPLVYYILNIGAGRKYLGKWFLFSMQMGDISGKHYLFVTGILCIVVAVTLRNARR